VKSRHGEACMEAERVSAGTRMRAEHWVDARKARMIRVRRDAVNWPAHRCVPGDGWRNRKSICACKSTGPSGIGTHAPCRSQMGPRCAGERGES
jgi:hypothetical protein